MDDRKVAIILKDRNHYTFLYEILKTLPQKASVILYTSDYYRNKKLSENIFKKKFTIPSLFKNSYKYDLIIIDEFYDSGILLLPLLIFHRKKVYLIIHNLVSWLKPNYNVELKNCLIAFFRKCLTRIFQNFIVVSPELKDWGLEHYPCKTFSFIPFRFHSEKIPATIATSNKIHVVVPGNISTRRSYENIIKLSNEDFIQKTYHFTLLGRPTDEYGQSVIKQVDKNSNFKVFEHFIPDETYDAILQQADLIMADFDPNYTTVFGQKEVYGKTKATGVPFIMLAYQKPGLLPGSYIGIREMDSQIVRFGNYKELKNSLKTLSEPGKLDTYKMNAIKNKLIIEKMIDKFE